MFVDFGVYLSLPICLGVGFELLICVHAWSSVACPKSVCTSEWRDAAFDGHSCACHCNGVFRFCDDVRGLLDRFLSGIGDVVFLV